MHRCSMGKRDEFVLLQITGRMQQQLGNCDWRIQLIAGRALLNFLQQSANELLHDKLLLTWQPQHMNMLLKRRQDQLAKLGSKRFRKMVIEVDNDPFMRGFASVQRFMNDLAGDEDQIALLHRIRTVMDEINPLSAEQIINFIIVMKMIIWHRERLGALHIFNI